MKYYVSQIGMLFKDKVFPHPTAYGLLFTFLVFTFRFKSYNLINHDAMVALFSKIHFISLPVTEVNPILIKLISPDTYYNFLLMFFAHALILLTSLHIAKNLGFTKSHQWAFIFLLCSHVLLNDYRQYVFIAPFYWTFCLLALWAITSHCLYRSVKLLLAGLFFYIACSINFTAWAWLIISPFFVFNLKLLKSKQILFILVLYFSSCFLLFFIPHFVTGQSGIEEFTILSENRLEEVDKIKGYISDLWLTDKSLPLSFMFLLVGSVVITSLWMLFSLGIVPIFMIYYGIKKVQFLHLNHSRINVVLWFILFDVLFTALYFFIQPNYLSSAFFTQVILLLMLASPGLAYVFDKLQKKCFSSHWQLMIFWLLFGYVLVGLIPFGPSSAYLKQSGQAFQNNFFYSNHTTVMFYGGQSPLSDNGNLITDETNFDSLKDKWVLFQVGRDEELPASLESRQSIRKFNNKHRDAVYVFAPE